MSKGALYKLESNRSNHVQKRQAGGDAGSCKQQTAADAREAGARIYTTLQYGSGQSVMRAESQAGGQACVDHQQYCWSTRVDWLGG